MAVPSSSLRTALTRSTQSLRPATTAARSLRPSPPSSSNLIARTLVSCSRTHLLPKAERLSSSQCSSLSSSVTAAGAGLGRRWNSSSSSAAADAAPAAETQAEKAKENPAIEAPEEGYKPQKIGQIEPRLQMTFTCTANECGHRSTHEFSKRAYTKGLVLVQCPECKSRHLIADHIGWFKESLEDGKLKTVEDLLAAKGEKIRKGRVNMDGDIEYEGED